MNIIITLMVLTLIPLVEGIYHDGEHCEKCCIPDVKKYSQCFKSCKVTCGGELLFFCDFQNDLCGMEQLTGDAGNFGHAADLYDGIIYVAGADYSSIEYVDGDLLKISTPSNKLTLVSGNVCVSIECKAYENMELKVYTENTGESGAIVFNFNESHKFDTVYASLVFTPSDKVIFQATLKSGNSMIGDTYFDIRSIKIYSGPCSPK